VIRLGWRYDAAKLGEEKERGCPFPLGPVTPVTVAKMGAKLGSTRHKAVKKGTPPVTKRRDSSQQVFHPKTAKNLPNLKKSNIFLG